MANAPLDVLIIRGGVAGLAAARDLVAGGAEVTVLEVRRIADLAMSKDLDVEMVYVGKNGQRSTMICEPQRFAFKGETLQDYWRLLDLALTWPDVPAPSRAKSVPL